MEMWEGAVLIVGGLWLVGKMTRHNPRPVGPGVASVLPSENLTNSTNTAGTTNLVAGEPLGVMAPPLLVSDTGSSGGCTQCGGQPFQPTAPSAPKPVVTPPIKAMPPILFAGGVPIAPVNKPVAVRPTPRLPVSVRPTLRGGFVGL